MSSRTVIVTKLLSTLVCFAPLTTNAFSGNSPTHMPPLQSSISTQRTSQLDSRLSSGRQQPSLVQLRMASAPGNDKNTALLLGEEFDSLLEKGKLAAAEELLRSHPNDDIITLENPERWNNVFRTIEEQTAQAEETVEEVNTRRMAEFPVTSQVRTEMTNMYQTLQNLGKLRVFGAISSQMPPAAGSHAVRPSLLEEITSLPMQALTPKQSNGLLYAGAAVAILEGIISVALHIDLNLLGLATLAFAITDRLLLNGAILESAFTFFSPGMKAKIQRHEAGHFLCAYLLGCPVEGCVLDAWSALQDSRFGVGRQVTAGTSFFDPILSHQFNSPKRQLTRSSIDRYSIIVMAGIAAEAMEYGQADGGASDEMALIAFLSQLNGGASVPPWNNVTIRNQARFGALQAVLMLREYRACYEALVAALEAGGDLGECVYAIEKAARDNDLGPLRDPVGYIVELPGDREEWTTEKPSTTQGGVGSFAAFSTTTAVATTTTTNEGRAATSQEATGKMTAEESLARLSAYRKSMEEKLKAIDDKLDGLQ